MKYGPRTRIAIYVSSRLGGVDGNVKIGSERIFKRQSHPAWDEWIEILRALEMAGPIKVSSRLGGVDGNMIQAHTIQAMRPSHPAWDEWIEIIKPRGQR